MVVGPDAVGEASQESLSVPPGHDDRVPVSVLRSAVQGSAGQGSVARGSAVHADDPEARDRAHRELEAISGLVVDLQARGLRLETRLEGRRGGAGPTDSGMLWVGGFPLTVPVDNDAAADSPYVLRAEDEGYGIYRGADRVADASAQQRPRFYDLSTDDGVPYWKIGLLHLDSFASTVVQTCNYWGNADQCTFCGIGVSLAAGNTIVKKTPEQLAEVARAARDLDGAVDATLTTGSSTAPDRGALYVARCGQAVTAASGLPVAVQFEPPRRLSVIDEVGQFGIDSVGIHVETFDPAVLSRVAPGKARTGIEAYFTAWERAVDVFGVGQVSTYVILGMGEDPEVTLDGCRRAVAMGVYPFVVPLRPVAGSLMESASPPDRAYTESIYREVAGYLQARGIGPETAKAGCARCQACSALGPTHRTLQLGMPQLRRAATA